MSFLRCTQEGGLFGNLLSPTNADDECVGSVLTYNGHELKGGLENPSYDSFHKGQFGSQHSRKPHVTHPAPQLSGPRPRGEMRCRQPVSLEVQRVELHSENSKDSSAVFSREDWILLVSSTDTQRFLSVQTFCCMGSSSWLLIVPENKTEHEGSEFAVDEVISKYFVGFYLPLPKESVPTVYKYVEENLIAVAPSQLQKLLLMLVLIFSVVLDKCEGDTHVHSQKASSLYPHAISSELPHHFSVHPRGLEIP
ncbi:hypothetical protein E5288_WYG018540 [Bos mutus]|uniref:Uncharacterized protein n=1 Tax=Bos mutus TaxID=72004 RepID=A0A6B0S2E3_9CETA|nr:hypothetical protein [Bos mutus]